MSAPKPYMLSPIGGRYTVWIPVVRLLDGYPTQICVGDVSDRAEADRLVSDTERLAQAAAAYKCRLALKGAK